MSVFAVSGKIDAFINIYLYNNRKNVKKSIYFQNPTWNLKGLFQPSSLYDSLILRNVIKDEILGKHGEKEI